MFSVYVTIGFEFLSKKSLTVVLKFLCFEIGILNCYTQKKQTCVKQDRDGSRTWIFLNLEFLSAGTYN